MLNTTTFANLLNTEFITSYDEIARSNYKLRSLCFHPSTSHKLYATAEHMLIEFDWSSNETVISVKAGGREQGKL